MFGKKILDAIAGKKALQGLFYSMYRLSVYGMNYGNGDVLHSGETNAARYVKAKLSGRGNTLILFDVGANQGKYSNRLASVFSGTSYRIHAFEPSPVIYQALKKQTAQLEHISLHQVGFSETKENRSLFKRAEMSGQSSVYQRRLDHFNMKMDMKEEISLTTIDEFCLQEGITHIHFLKMDVEGHELSCLKGASTMIKNGAIDFIQFEFGGCNIDSRTYLQDFWYLLHDQYKFYRIVKDGLMPIDQYNERWEIFKNINFLLEKKA